MTAPTLRVGALYRVKRDGAWTSGRCLGCFLGAYVWQIESAPLPTSRVEEVAESVVEVDWVRDPFAATVRISAMVRVMR